MTPKGNKCGRPRTRVPEKEELIELGKKLVAWAEKKHEDGENIRVRFCDWYTAEGFVMKQWEHMREKPEFQWYYERARSIMALRYVDGTVNQSIAHRYLRIYDPEVRFEEDQQKEFESKLKKDSESNKPTNIIIQVPNDLASGSKLQA